MAVVTFGSNILGPSCALTWVALSVLITLTNKHVLITFPFPITLTTLHLVMTSAVARLLAYTQTISLSSQTYPTGPPFYSGRIVLVGLFFGLNLILNNISYMYLSVTFIQMFKAISPIVVIAVGWLVGVYQFQPRTLVVTCIICLGVILSSYGEVAVSYLGILIQVAAIASEAIRLVQIEVLLSPYGLNANPFTSLFLLTPLAALLCFFFAIVIELPTISIDALLSTSWLALLGSAVLAVLLNISAVFVIANVSALTLSICGIPRAMLTMSISSYLWNDQLSPLQMAGFLISSVGLICYSALKVRLQRLSESDHSKQPSSHQYSSTESISRTEEV
ncbi:triose-phosphate transporter family-domain-containing protein [Aspergillus alliaceus]|uniref:triose-phosphate transporter family-domain-containing protein n=1 Tax=Petromyces alliaceus TaxID=209559 RepID=UPI0012A51C55|nr:triose-phosphate transporter family-domain-containing protein [Aspergillus alliaceus]KAB8228039.1 triose-phosphate transporter family-domain-containing protein [Aspergillus alliaceus]